MTALRALLLFLQIIYIITVKKLSVFLRKLFLSKKNLSTIQYFIHSFESRMIFSNEPSLYINICQYSTLSGRQLDTIYQNLNKVQVSKLGGKKRYGDRVGVKRVDARAMGGIAKSHRPRSTAAVVRHCTLCVAAGRSPRARRWAAGTTSASSAPRSISAFGELVADKTRKRLRCFSTGATKCQRRGKGSPFFPCMLRSCGTILGSMQRALAVWHELQSSFKIHFPFVFPYKICSSDKKYIRIHHYLAIHEHDTTCKILYMWRADHFSL